jgi:hypothetical protein
MILLPGVRSQRVSRRSRLAFYWHARDASLEPVTGQVPTLLQLGGVGLTGGPVVPGVGATIAAGKAMPRFSREAATGLNYLELSGNTTNQDVEELLYAGSFPARDLTMLVRLKGLWTAGATLAEGAMFGLGGDGATAAGGAIGVTRTSTYWQASRATPGGSASVNLTEPGSLTWPVDVLLSYNGTDGKVQVALRDAAGVVSTSAWSSTGYPTVGERMGTALAWFCASSPAGHPARYYWIKVAMGLYTFTQMDGLT